MTPAEAIAEMQAGKARPVYLVVGEERIFADRIVTAARKHVVEPAAAGFNIEAFEAGEGSIERALDAAKTTPMMATRRLIIVRGLERFEAKADDAGAGEARESKGKPAVPPLDRLAEYVAAPVASACLVLVAAKSNKGRRLYKAADKAHAIVGCEPLRPQQLPAFVRDEAKLRGATVSSDVAAHLVDLIGGDLAALSDAVERLSLYAGAGAAIDDAAVEALVARVSIGSSWGIADAIASKNRGAALRLLNENYDHRDRGIPLLAMIASSMRKTLKMRALLASGAAPEEAARQAGVPPFKAREVAEQAKRFKRGELERAIGAFAETDMALKGASKRPALLVLEELITRLT